jgi:hypothetical protein
LPCVKTKTYSVALMKGLRAMYGGSGGVPVPPIAFFAGRQKTARPDVWRRGELRRNGVV